MLRTFHYIDTDMLSREILFERKLTPIRGICRNNADELFLVNDLGQQRRWHMTFIANQSKIQPAVTQILEDIASPTREGEAHLFRNR